MSAASSIVSQLCVVRYTHERKAEWDLFVSTSRNGTFLLHRNYMDYHADRFDDCSLLFYKGNCLIAVLPGNINGTTYQSHGGLTYGGFVLSDQVGATLMLQLFSLLRTYLHSQYPALATVVYRPIPAIYHRYVTEEDLYALFRIHARLTERKLSSTVSMNAKLPFSTLRRRKIKRAKAAGLMVCQDENFSEFWNILEGNLQDKHCCLPVHSLEEMIRLQRLFPQEIKLYRMLNGSETVGGCVMYVTSEVAHVQYIASTEAGRDMGGLDLLFDFLIHTCYADKRYFDFGVSVENGGLYLNEGLIFQKEGFGGRGVVYDAYEFNIITDEDDKIL